MYDRFSMEELIVKEIEQYNKARREIESHFKGLPHAHTTLIKSLINVADPITGIILGVSYHDLSMLLTIDQANGRIDSGTPKKETIRSYLRSIEKQCHSDFQVISEGQKLQFKFPNLPSIYASYFSNEEVYTEQIKNKSTDNHVEKHKKIDKLQDEKYMEQYTEVYTEILPVKNNNKYINNNNNTNSLSGFSDNQKLKQPIASDFHPSQEILERAFASGYSFAADADVIQEFIDKNKAWGSQFADFNPVYLSFIAKYNDHKKQPETQKMQTRSNSNDRPFTKTPTHDEALARVKADHPNAIAPSESVLFPASKTICIEAEHSPYRLVMGGVDENLRSIVCQQKRL